MIKESLEHHRQGRLDEAEQGYRASLAENPNDFDALHLLGLLRHQRGDMLEGVALIERARALAPDDASIISTLATLDLRRGELESARSGYLRAIELDPNLGGAHSGIGQIALLGADHAEAERNFRIALRAGEDAQALAGLGIVMFDRGDNDAALAYLGRAAELAPEDAMTQYLLGCVFAKKGVAAFAERAFENALRLNPAQLQTRVQLGELLLNHRRFRDAEAHYLALANSAQFSTIAYFGLGDIARAESRFEDAVAAYRSALTDAPLQAAAVRALATCLIQLQRPDEARTAIDGYLERVPGDRETAVAAADLFAQTGEFTFARAYWQALCEADPNDTAAQVQAASLAERCADYDAAVAGANRVLAARSDDADMLLLCCRAALRVDDVARAQAILDALSELPLSAANARFRAHCSGLACDRRGEVDAAVSHFRNAQKTLPRWLPTVAELSWEISPPGDDANAADGADGPTLLVGTPASGADRVAALLADQPQVSVLHDRIGALLRTADANLAKVLDPAALSDERAIVATLRDRYFAPLRSTEPAAGTRVVDWIPRWDPRAAASIRRVLPGARFVIVERDLRDTLLNWLAWGWVDGLPCADPEEGATWLARARENMDKVSGFEKTRRLIINVDEPIESNQGALSDLARFLDIEPIRPGAQFAAATTGLGGLPTRFARDRWQAYGEALGAAFRQLD